MQPQKQPLSVPRRALDVEDYIDVIRRHKAWILGPTFVGLVLAVVVAFLWPDTFVSTAVLKVDPQKVPEKYVQSNVTMEMSARVQSMAMEILSRPVLINIIKTNNLYPREQKSMPIEDLVEQMRNKDILIGGLNSQLRGSSRYPSFQISFRYENRYAAQRICNELVSRFIDENIRTRTDQSVTTTDFLRQQYDSSKKELEDVEMKITQFRIANQGRLPEQLQANLQQLSALEARMNLLQSNLSRLNQDKMLLEARLRTLKDQMTTLTTPQPHVEQQKAAINEKLAQIDREIERAEVNLSSVRERYTDNHPDVQRYQQVLAWLKKQREAVVKQDQASREAAAKEAPKTAANPNVIIQMSPTLQKQVQEVQGLIDQVEMTIRSRDMETVRTDQELKEADKQVRVLQVRIEASPLNEPAYQQLLRDRDAARERYVESVRKKSLSETATLIEDQKRGENLSLLEPPTLPQIPTYPNRWLIVATGTLLGLLAGVFLAGAREMKDTTLKNLKDVRAYTQLPVLGSVPLLENDLVVLRHRRIGWLAWSTVVFLGIMIMSGSVYYYFTVTRV
jgi:polysaccharide chain length determinant protein (PEP-CTERM system associated)